MPRKSKDQIFNESLAEVVNEINKAFTPPGKKMKKITPEDIANLPTAEELVNLPEYKAELKKAAKKPAKKKKP